MTSEVDVAVVGAGPAGLAAAIEAARGGATVAVVDDQARPGGQIYRQPPSAFAVARRPRGAGYAVGKALIAEAAATPGIRWLHETTAWGVFRGDLDDYPDLALDTPAGLAHLSAAQVIVAAGAYDLPLAFPGWTLPGVMAAGGVQAFVKSQQFLPGRRFVLAGAHPLLVVVADQLLDVGAKIAAVAIARARPGMHELAADFVRIRGSWTRLGDLAGPLARLRRAKIPVLLSTVPVAAEGEQTLERVRLSRLDRHGRLAGRPFAIECDTLALGFGFLASSELARQIGCATRWDPDAGGWVVEHDEWMRTSVARVAVAGEVAGVAGAEQAVEEGRLAALGALVALSRLDEAEARRRAAPVRRRLAARRRFSRVVRTRFAPPSRLIASLATDETVVCRCEEITAGTIRESVADHPYVGTLDAVKLLTRAGMGPCQGRMCHSTVAEIVAECTGRPAAELGPFRARPPVKPVSLERLAAAATRYER